MILIKMKSRGNFLAVEISLKIGFFVVDFRVFCRVEWGHDLRFGDKKIVRIQRLSIIFEESIFNSKFLITKNIILHVNKDLISSRLEIH